MAFEWYVQRQGKEAGPLTGERLKQLADSGLLAPTDLVRRSDRPKLVEARNVRGLFNDDQVARPSTPPSPRTRISPPPLPEVGQSDSTQGPLSLPIVIEEEAVGKPSRMVGLGSLAGVIALGAIIFVARINERSSTEPIDNHAASGIDNPTLGLDDAEKQNKPALETGASATPAEQRPEVVGPRTETQPEVPSRNLSVLPEPSRPVAAESLIPDYSTVDYSHDFSKDDASEPPAGLTKRTRAKRFEKADLDRTDEGEQELLGTWLEDSGYGDGRGRFIRDGLRTVWYDRTKQQKYLEDSWSGGQRHGRLMRWHRRGTKRTELMFVWGKVHGYLRHWHSDGTPSFETAYLDDREHGIRTEWYRNGQKSLQVAVVNGMNEGEQRAWHENGQLREVALVHHDKYQGLVKGWTKDGLLWGELNYRDGKLHGEVTRFLTSGPRKGEKIGPALYDQGVLTRSAFNLRTMTRTEFIGLLMEASDGYNARSGYALWDEEIWTEMVGKPDRVAGVGLGPGGQHRLYVCSDGPVSLHLRAGLIRKGQIALELDR